MKTEIRSKILAAQGATSLPVGRQEGPTPARTMSGWQSGCFDIIINPNFLSHANATLRKCLVL
jgi:hypothetical protein